MPARRLKKGTLEARNKSRYSPVVFLPNHLEQVKAIAMRGLSDTDMAAVFGIEPELMKKWKEFYPSFKEAIEEGRTEADARVTQALFERATGYEHPDEKIFFDSETGGIVRARTTKHYPPDHASIKTWMTNRQKEHWKDRQHVGVSGGSGDDSPIGIRNETKQELMSSILSLIQPKDDPEDADP